MAHPVAQPTCFTGGRGGLGVKEGVSSGKSVTCTNSLNKASTTGMEEMIQAFVIKVSSVDLDFFNKIFDYCVMN